MVMVSEETRRAISRERLHALMAETRRNHSDYVAGVPDVMTAADGSKVPARRINKKKFMRGIRELGSPGTIFSDGFLLFEDLNSKWRDLDSRCAEVTNMIRTDGMVRATIMACKMPLMASKWSIRAPVNKATAKERDQAKFADENFNGLTNPWVETLDQILTYHEFGFSWFEKVYDPNPDGKLYLKKLAHRMPHTVSKWNVDRDGGLRSVTQRVVTGDAGKSREVDLSVDRLVIFTNEKRGANWEGESILRSAYKHYYLKDRIERIDAIAHERHGVGIPVIEIPPGTNPDHMKLAEKILRDLRSHEKGYVIIPVGWVVRILEMKTSMRDPIGSINYHNQMIASSTLTNFLNYGMSRTGSKNLGETNVNFLLSVLNTRSAYVCGILDRHAVKQLIEFNYGEQERYPRWNCTPIGGINLENMSRALMMAGQNHYTHVDNEVVEHVHDLFSLPPPDFNQEDRNAQLPNAENKTNPVGGNDSKAKEKPNPKSPEDQKKVAESLVPFIRLQVESMMMHGSNGRFQPPLEGTLFHAMLAPYGGDIDRDVAQRAATEFSRRLASAASIGYLGGGDYDGARASALAEAERSMPFLLDGIKPIEKVQVTTATEGSR